MLLSMSLKTGQRLMMQGKQRSLYGGTLLLYTGACISATRIFTDGQQKAGRIHVLTIPVSMFENWLARTLLFVVGYFVVFHVIFYALEIMRYLLLSSAFPNVDIRIAHPVMWLGFGSNGLLNILYATAWYVFAVSFFMLGSFVFPRKPLLGTTISAFVVVAHRRPYSVVLQCRQQRFFLYFDCVGGLARTCKSVAFLSPIV